MNNILKLEIGTTIKRTGYSSGFKWFHTAFVSTLPIGLMMNQVLINPNQYGSISIGQNIEILSILRDKITVKVEYAAGGIEKPFYFGHTKMVILKKLNSELYDLIIKQSENENFMTKEEFDIIVPGTVFAEGVSENSPKGIYMTSSKVGDPLKWLAKKGYGNDWAIYCYWAYASTEYIMNNGEKVCNKENILKLVPCEENVLNLYRF